MLSNFEVQEISNEGSTSPDEAGIGSINCCCCPCCCATAVIEEKGSVD